MQCDAGFLAGVPLQVGRPALLCRQREQQPASRLRPPMGVMAPSQRGRRGQCRTRCRRNKDADNKAPATGATGRPGRSAARRRAAPGHATFDRRPRFANYRAHRARSVASSPCAPKAPRAPMMPSSTVCYERDRIVVDAAGVRLRRQVRVLSWFLVILCGARGRLQGDRNARGYSFGCFLLSCLNIVNVACPSDF